MKGTLKQHNMNTLNVSVSNVVNHADISAVELTVQDEYETFQVTGISKRDPLDRTNKPLGLELAFARALELAGQKLMARARGRVKHIDDIKAQKQQIKVESAKKVSEPVKKVASKPAKKVSKRLVAAKAK